MAAAAAAVVAISVGAVIMQSGGPERSDRPTPADSVGPVPAASVVPYADLPPVDMEGEVLATSLSDCVTSDLEASAGTQYTTDGSVKQILRVQNTGNTVCRIPPAPTSLRVNGPGGVSAFPLRGDEPVGKQVEYLALAADESAEMALSWPGHCGPDAKSPKPEHTAMQLVIGKHELEFDPANLRLPIGCVEDDVLLVEPFTGHTVHSYAGPMINLVPAIQLPRQVKVAEYLKYTVTLTNPTDEDIALEPCPSFFAVAITGEGPPERRGNQLNCSKAGRVPAQGAVAFALELFVPDYFYDGDLVIRWDMSVLHDSAVGSVEVDGQPTPQAAVVACIPAVTEVPCAPGVVSGVSYPYQLYTHCGVRDIYADGKYWVPVDRALLADSKPPPGYAELQLGGLTRTAEEVLEFRPESGSGAPILFEPGEPYPGGCL